MSDYDPRDPKRKMILSVSQVETYDMCARKWWFGSGLPKPDRLPQVERGSQTFGTVLHAVCERFLSADDLGRDKHGNPVDLYPPGWQECVQEFGSSKGRRDRVDDADAARIKLLITQAIEKGVLVRMPGRRVEHPFNLPLGTYKGVEVELTGKIDLLLHDTVVDHKSAKSMAYAKSANALKKSVQMMVYAKVALEEARRRGEALPATITLQHNVFCKDPDDLRVRKTTTDAADGGNPTVAEIEKFWTNFLSHVEPMLDLRATPLRIVEGGRLVENWSATPEPTAFAQACNAFGGCPYRTICTGRESAQTYVKRTAAIISPPAPQIEPKEEPYMAIDIASRLAAKRAAAAGGVPPVQPSQQPKPDPDPVTAAVIAQAAPATYVPGPVGTVGPVTLPTAQGDAGLHPDAAPWTRANCTPCKGADGLRSGWNSKGNPCGVCTNLNDKEGKPTYKNYDQAEIDAFRQQWLDSQGKATATVQVKDTPKAEPVAPPVAQVGAADPTPSEPPAQATETALPSTPQDQAQAAPEPTPTTPAAPTLAGRLKRGPGRPRKDVAVAPPAAEIPAPAATDGGPAPDHAPDPAAIVKPGAGRPKTGFTLYLNCMPSRGFAPGTVLHLDVIMRRYQDAMVEQCAAEGKPVETYWAINAFVRRDMMSRAAEQIAVELGANHVVGRGLSPDMVAFLDAIRPFAARVVEGTN